MPTIRRRTAVAAASTNDNILSGDTFEFVNRPTQVQIWASTDDIANTRYNVRFGDRTMGVNLRPNPEVNVGQVDVQRDMLLDEIALPGERLTIAISNDDAAATQNMNTLVKLTPIA